MGQRFVCSYLTIKNLRILDGLKGTRVYIDNVLVWGRMQEEHNKHLRGVLKAVQAFNHETCIFSAEEVYFLSDLISKDFTKPDAQLVKCFANMPLQASKQGVRNLLSAANYFSRFILNLSERTRNLCVLL